jgi:8-oxo-dGTP pyrophosphatase MutT (NUDIX family)
MEKITKDNNNFVSVAIIYDTVRKVLLLQYRDKNAQVSPEKWGLFGGHKASEENPDQTLIRELNEEIGIQLSPADIKQIDNYQMASSLRRFVYLIDKIKSDVKISLTEGQTYEWVPQNKVLSYNLTEMARYDVGKFLKQPDYDKAGNL